MPTPFGLLLTQELVFDDFGDSTHGAFLHALTAGDACIFVCHLGAAPNNLEHLLRTSIDADTTTDALVSVNNRMSHDDPFQNG